MKATTSQVTAGFPLCPSLTEGNVLSCLYGSLPSRGSDPVEDGWGWSGAAAGLPASASSGTNVCAAALSVGARTIRLPRQGRGSRRPQASAPARTDPLRGAGPAGLAAQVPPPTTALQRISTCPFSITPDQSRRLRATSVVRPGDPPATGKEDVSWQRPALMVPVAQQFPNGRER